MTTFRLSRLDVWLDQFVAADTEQEVALFSRFPDLVRHLPVEEYRGGGGRVWYTSASQEVPVIAFELGDYVFIRKDLL